MMKTKQFFNNFFLSLIIINLFIFKGFCLPSTDSALAEVNKAQESFLQKNGNLMIEYAKSALKSSNNHPMILENIIPLINKAEREGMLNNINPNWKLPEQIEYLSIISSRRYHSENQDTRYNITVSTTTKEKDIIDQIQLIYYPNEVIVDVQAKVGEFGGSQYHQRNNFWVKEKSHTNLNKPGLYLLNIKTKGHPIVQGWFILTNENASNNPTVLSPTINQTFNTSTPTFAWNNFHSQEFSDHEETRIQASISKDQSSYVELFMSDFKYMDNKKVYSLKLGDCKECKYSEGVNTLQSGDYIFNVRFSEVHEFGDIYLNRSSNTTVPFTVQ